MEGRGRQTVLGVQGFLQVGGGHPWWHTHGITHGELEAG